MRQFSVIFYLCCHLLLLLACAKSPDSQRTEGQTVPVWDDNSVRLTSPTLGGSGPWPPGLFSQRTPTSPKCRLNAKWYSFDKSAATFTKYNCLDVIQGYTEHRVALTANQVENMVQILKNVGSVARYSYSGVPCPADWGGAHGQTIEIEQSDGTVHILSENPNPCGSPNSRYVHGALPSLSFLDQLELSANQSSSLPSR